MVSTEKYAAVRTLARRAAICDRGLHRGAQVNQTFAECIRRVSECPILIKTHRMARQILLIDISGCRHQHRIEFATVFFAVCCQCCCLA